MNKEEFGKLLTTLRKKGGMSQKELADKLSVSTSAISKWEHGKNLPDMTMFNRIAEIFQVSCDDLHNPIRTLEKLENPTYQEEASEETQKTQEMRNEEEGRDAKRTEKKIKKYRAVVGLFIFIAVFVVAIGFVISSTKQEQPAIQQVGTRYIDDPLWGKSYEIAFVVEGEIDLALESVMLDEIYNRYKDDPEIESTTVKLSYYNNEKAALAWEETEYIGYVFLDVE
ncbi:MAG: helix-turn-helix transcriptional regulator [Lachnospiraceae bacterium]|nr:helix-turn-helix transcriptional regulator [Lachnospiraceae bacterium]